MTVPVPAVVSVNVGLPKDVPWQGKTVHTGIWKDPVTGPVMVRRLNIDGDGQGDLAGHGGEQRAVFVYQLDSYRHWEQHFGRDDFVYGMFGENLTVDGLPDDEVCIGDRYRIGEAEFEVTQPRVTCYRVGMRVGEPQLPALLVSHHRPGFYLRVLTEGRIQAGDAIVKISTGPEALSVADTDALLPLAILETVLLRSSSWGVTELAAALGLPKARIHRHLANLRAAGYLSQNAGSRRYEPGWRLVVLGQRIQATAQVVRLAGPVMTELRDRVGQTVVLSALSADGVVVTDVVAGGSPIDVILSPGTVFQYNASAQGKVALAFASPRQRSVWSTLMSERRTPKTVVDATRLWREVDAAREQGWADGPEETFSASMPSPPRCSITTGTSHTPLRLSGRFITSPAHLPAN